MCRFIFLIGLMLGSATVHSQESEATLPGKDVARELIELALTQMKEVGTWRNQMETVLAFDIPLTNGMTQDESYEFYGEIGDSYFANIGIECIWIRGDNILDPPDLIGIPIITISIIRHEEDRYLVIVKAIRHMEDERGRSMTIGRIAHVFTKSINGIIQLSHVHISREGRQN